MSNLNQTPLPSQPISQDRVLAVLVLRALVAIFLAVAGFVRVFAGEHVWMQWACVALVCLVLLFLVSFGILDAVLRFLVLIDSPEKEQGETHKRSTLRLLGVWVLACAAWFLAVSFLFITPAFQELMEGFGMDLPLFTAFALKNGFSGLFGIVGLVASLLAISVSVRRSYSLRQKQKVKVAFKSLFMAALGLFLLTIVALYLPIFKIPLAVG